MSGTEVVWIVAIAAGVVALWLFPVVVFARLAMMRDRMSVLYGLLAVLCLVVGPLAAIVAVPVYFIAERLDRESPQSRPGPDGSDLQ